MAPKAAAKEERAQPTSSKPTKRKASDHQPNTKRQKQESTSASSRHPFTVAAFGSGENAELGLGPSTTEAKRPKTNPYLDRTNDLCKYGNVIGLACGGMHGVAFTADNRIITWGVNDEGALGRDTDWEGGLRDVDDEDEEADLNPLESIPSEVNLGLLESEKIVQVEAGDNCTFALTSAGHVYGWGTFRSGQGDAKFGYDKNGAIIKNQHTPMLIPGLKNITQLACGTNHVLALDKNGSIFGWGINDENQLGHRFSGRNSDTFIPRQLRVCRTKVKRIFSGQCHSFAVDVNDNVWGWGRNGNAETGAPITGGASFPTRIPSLSGIDVLEMAGGGNHSVAMTRWGSCFAWGRMDIGQLGVDFAADQLNDDSLFLRDSRNIPRVCLKPVAVTHIGKVCAVACGNDHTLFLNNESAIFSAGFGDSGQLGHGSDDDEKVARQVQAKRPFSGGVWAGGNFSMAAGLW